MFVRCGCFVVALLLLCGGGCNQRAAKKPEQLDIAPYAALPGVAETHNEELQAEIARLFSEQATPLQLMAAEASTSVEQVIADQSTEPAPYATRLGTIFPKNFHESALEKIDKVWPTEGFEFTPANLHVAAALSKRYRMKREQFEQVVSEPDFALPVNHALGLSVDVSYLDAIAIGQRLIGLRVAEMIAANRPEAAVESLRLMLRISEVLSAEKHIASRNAGALRRGEALQVLDGIAQHPSTTRGVQQQLRMLVDRQLRNWPDDQDAWIGDRAQGLHTFELVRDGHLLSLLSYDEVREYRDEVGIQQLAKVVADNIDVDELFYLQTMRDLIDVCRQPHHQRSDVFARIETNLELLRQSDEYPFVSDQLLLLQLDQTSRLMALDRARCEAWVIALQIAIDGESPPAKVNPLTGDEYFVDISDQLVIVDAIDPEHAHRAAIVPRLSQDQPIPQVGSPLLPAVTR